MSEADLSEAAVRQEPPTIAFVVAANDEQVLRSSLLASPDVANSVQVNVQRGAACAAQAYNRGMREVKSDVLVFAHQDVFLPAGWLACLSAALAHLAMSDPNWGVLGVYGVDTDNCRRGWTYSNGLGRVLGEPFPTPQPVRTLDEMVLVIRRGCGLRFDESLPGFHMYGTDICLAAERRGMRNYVVPCFALHNSNGIAALPWSFWKACFHVWRSHQDSLPVQSPCVVLTKSRLGLISQAVRHCLGARLRPRPVGSRVTDPAALHQQLMKNGRLSKVPVHE